MDIVFANQKQEKEFNNQKILVKKHGSKRAKKIRQRLDDLKDAHDLEKMRSVPGRCHELLYNRAGQFSLDLDQPYRLIFEPAHNPIPRKPDGGIDWTLITSIKIIAVDDTHE